MRLAEDAGEADEDTGAETYVLLQYLLQTHSPPVNHSAWSGFVLAMKDPKVLIMSVMSCSQLLGLRYVWDTVSYSLVVLIRCL